jgi:hypothetical protein
MSAWPEVFRAPIGPHIWNFFRDFAQHAERVIRRPVQNYQYPGTERASSWIIVDSLQRRRNSFGFVIRRDYDREVTIHNFISIFNTIVLDIRFEHRLVCITTSFEPGKLNETAFFLSRRISY